jgi:hypothetical protein
MATYLSPNCQISFTRKTVRFYSGQPALCQRVGQTSTGTAPRFESPGWPQLNSCVPRLDLARGNSAGIELFHQAFVGELFHKPVVNEIGDERFGGLARYS